jgi:hypothetical protein
MDEDTELLPKVLDLAKTLRWTLRFHDYVPLRNGRGFLDLLMLHPGRGLVLAAELKSHRGRVTPEQNLWLDGWRAVAATAPNVLVHVWRPLDLLDGTIAKVLART